MDSSMASSYFSCTFLSHSALYTELYVAFISPDESSFIIFIAIIIPISAMILSIAAVPLPHELASHYK